MVLDELAFNEIKNDDVPQLINKTMNALNLLSANVQETAQRVDAIKAV